jgi:hypothetical protein
VDPFETPGSRETSASVQRRVCSRVHSSHALHTDSRKYMHVLKRVEAGSVPAAFVWTFGSPPVKRGWSPSAKIRNSIGTRM